MGEGWDGRLEEAVHHGEVEERLVLFFILKVSYDVEEQFCREVQEESGAVFAERHGRCSYLVRPVSMGAN